MNRLLKELYRTENIHRLTFTHHPKKTLSQQFQTCRRKDSDKLRKHFLPETMAAQMTSMRPWRASLAVLCLASVASMASGQEDEFLSSEVSVTFFYTFQEMLLPGLPKMSVDL